MQLPRFRYRLSTLLLVFLVFGCLFGWLARNRNLASRQHKAVAAIESLGGQVLYDYNARDESAEPQISPMLNSLFGKDFFCNVVEVRWSYQPALKNDDLAYLKDLPHLKTLILSGGTVTAEGLVHIHRLRSLEDLSLGIEMTNDDLNYLRPTNSLKELYLMGPRPEGFVTRMQDHSKRIYDAPMYDSLVTKEGVEGLASSLPNCRISY